jgi:D-lactate dehydrogenase (cytochrome)
MIRARAARPAARADAAIPAQVASIDSSIAAQPAHAPSPAQARSIDAAPMRRDSDPDSLVSWLEDAARYPGGHSPEVCFPASEADVALLAAEGRPLLIVGAQSSLTGGATPRGETLVSTSRLAAMREWTSRSVWCGAGVVLRDLDAECARRGLYFPPIPTYDGATVGGAVSTDAAGAQTFKHGTTRAWVDALTVVLAGGDVLDVERGAVTAHPDGYFEIERSSGSRTRVPVPRAATPAVPKSSAGYRGGPALDLVDLFVGSEGTLGVVTEVRLRLLEERPAWLAVLIPVRDDAEAAAVTHALRLETAAARGDASRADVAAIEYMDERCVAILREDGVLARVGVTIPASTRALLLAQVELPPSCDRARAIDELSDPSRAGPVASLRRVLESHGLLATAVPALPGEEDRRRALFALREAVPEGVNARVRAAALSSGEPVSKSGGDAIVPFERFAEALGRYREILAATGLDAAIWGHISDGNVHPNLIATGAATMEKARAAQLAIGEVAIALGGSPLAEHGTGRNPVKKKLLAMLHGEAGVASMRATKRALDPAWLLAPGVLFDPPQD